MEKSHLDKNYESSFNEAWEIYTKNPERLESNIIGFKRNECREVILSILNKEYRRLVEEKKIKLNKKKEFEIPKNLQLLLEFDKENFNGAIRKSFVSDLETVLSELEGELYDNPADFDGGDYYDEDESEHEQDFTIDDWVEEQTLELRAFIDALDDFK